MPIVKEIILMCVLPWLAMIIVYDDSHLNSIVETLTDLKKFHIKTGVSHKILHRVCCTTVHLFGC